MANTSTRTQDTDHHRDDPVLRPGRPADPGEADSTPSTGETGSARPGHSRRQHPDAGDAADKAAREQAAPAEQDEGERSEAGSEELDRHYAEAYQRKLRRLLRQCERVNLMDFNVLSLAGWPDSYTLNAARRRRDSWVLSAVIAALVFLSGMTGVVPAWIAGGGFGALVVILLLGVPFVRRLYSSRPSYFELILYRRQLLQDARRHVAHLEGDVGLIWQCRELAEFNPTLASPRFSTLRHLSEQRRLAGSLTRREHIRLYLIFMLEAEKAYERMQNVYFEGHQKAIDRGWYSVAQAMTEAPEDKDGGRESPANGDRKAGPAASHGPRPEEDAAGDRREEEGGQT
ncbi:MAG: hypothetical protein ACOCVV_07030 [Marinobacter sp.]